MSVSSSHSIIFIRPLLQQPADFPNPTAVDPRRPRSTYNLNGAGFHNCPGVTYVEQTIAETIKVVFKLKNVRRAPGSAGKLSGFKAVANETETNVFVKPNGMLSAWPGAMVLMVSRPFCWRMRPPDWHAGLFSVR